MKAQAAALSILLGACSGGGGSVPPLPASIPPVAVYRLPPSTPLIIFPTQPDGSQTRDLCLNPSQWPIGWTRMTALGMAIQWWEKWTDADIAQCFVNLRAAGKGLVVETWALKPQGVCTSATECWTDLAPILARLQALGAPPMSVALDEPLTGSETYATPIQAADETTAWIGMARAVYPGVPVILEEAWPHHDVDALIAYVTAVNAAAPGGLQVVAIDHDWQGNSDTSGVVSIETAVRAAGMNFEIIAWNASGVMDWSTGLARIRQIYAGLTFDQLAIMDWTGEPPAALPEADPATFSGSVKSFLEN